MAEGEPKPLVFPPKSKAEEREPKPLNFGPKTGGDHEPRPLDFTKMTTDWIAPERPEKKMAEPKGLNFASPKPSAPASEPRGLKLPEREPNIVEVHTIRGVIGHIDTNSGVYTSTAPEDLLSRLRPQQAPAAPREMIIGGDPRAPALLEKAKTINASLAAHRLFRNRLESFLDLRPAMWATWAESDLTVLVGSASAQAEFARKLSLANAVKWASDCEQAYKKPPRFLDRLTAPKPEFYRERLTQARDILISVANEIDTVAGDLKPRLEKISLDALVLQVATADVTDPSDQITATRRLQTLVGGQQTGEMIVQALEVLGQTIANQKATVSDLLTVTIPNWILAQSKA